MGFPWRVSYPSGSHRICRSRRQPHHRLACSSPAFWGRGPQAQTGNMVYTPTFRKRRGRRMRRPYVWYGCPLPIARQSRARETLRKFVSYPHRACGLEGARKAARDAAFTISCPCRASVERCANLYLYPHRPSAWRTNASPTGVHLFRVMGEGTKGIDREHGLHADVPQLVGATHASPARPSWMPAADCTPASRARDTAHICIFICTDLRGEKGPENRPGHRLHEFLPLSRER